MRLYFISKGLGMGEYCYVSNYESCVLLCIMLVTYVIFVCSIQFFSVYASYVSTSRAFHLKVVACMQNQHKHLT